MLDPVVNLPNLLSVFRLLCVPALLGLAWHGATTPFLVLFGLGLLSDVLDGAVARRLGQESALGARLDQTADFAIWSCLPLAAWWLWPEILRREAAWVILSIACLLLPTAIAYGKYRAVPGYHTWTAKTSAVWMGAALPLLLIFELAGPFRIGALLLLVAAVDQLAITGLLVECRHDVPSMFHAVRMRRP